ncbi:hypothetical protein E0Z10_g5906 [Xylaria hypoxylon]|uniref:Uncharacterized protein n=1 Tax=Xylaria hypoxylon TaxID=37992 RepID=A0A4Z0YEY7_9PEZI|nr:hypothetical protein E0Z10_g5906 [Xylaria hypoxylon]
MPNEELPYDFIVVGAGASGCAIASGLVRSNRLPRVLLLEAGGANNDATHRDLRALPWRTPMIARSAWTPAKAWEDEAMGLAAGAGPG